MSDAVGRADLATWLAQTGRDDPDLARYLLDETPVPIVATDTVGNLIYWNAAAAELHGWHGEEAIGRNIQHIVVPESEQGKLLAGVEQVLTRGHWSGEADMMRGGGGTFPALINLKLVGDADTGIILGTAADLSGRRALEAQLLQSQKMEALGTLAGGMAHEFNNLLVAIIGAANLARNEVNDEAELNELLELVESAGLRGKELVSQVLGFSRRDKPRVEPMEPADMVNDLMRLIRPTLSRGIEIKKEVTSGLPRLAADRSILVNALLNLCINSADAMGESGNLTLRVDGCRGVPSDDVDQAAIEQGDFVVLAVEDDGAGMSRQMLPRSLDPFFTTKGKGKGTGLGLPLVRSTIEAQGGHLRIWSGEGRGTKVSVYLPVAESRREEPTGPAKKSSGHFRGTETILVVDDDEMVRRVSRRALRRCGYEVLEANDGIEGLEVVAARPGEIHLVLLDMVMPRMDGREFFWKLKDLSPEIPVLLNSGFSVEGRVGQLLDGGAAGFLKKPFELVDLLRAVRNAIDGEPVQVG